MSPTTHGDVNILENMKSKKNLKTINWKKNKSINSRKILNLKFKNNVSLNDFHQSSANILNLIVSLKIRLLTFDLLITNTVTEIKEQKVKFGRKSQFD